MYFSDTAASAEWRREVGVGWFHRFHFKHQKQDTSLQIHSNLFKSIHLLQQMVATSCLLLLQLIKNIVWQLNMIERTIHHMVIIGLHHCIDCFDEISQKCFWLKWIFTYFWISALNGGGGMLYGLRFVSYCLWLFSWLVCSKSPFLLW